MLARRKKSRLPLIVLVLAVMAGAAFWLVRQSAPEVAVVHPHRGRAVEAVYATGTVEPVSWARISPVGSGRIAEMLVREGERVREGQPLARLDDREARARIAELEARAAYWREEVRRAQALADKGIKSREAEQKAQSELGQVQAAISAARQRRADLLVTSPLDGEVLRRDFEVGEVVDVNDALFWVGAPRPLRVTADVDEEDIADIRPGQKVLIKADAFPDRVLEGKVDRVTPKGDPINKTFRVRVALPDETPLLVGMTAEVNVITKEKADALLIPAGAVAGGQALVVADGLLQARPVRLGVRGRSEVEVVEGLAPGDRVVAAPSSALKAGERVRASGP